MTLFYDRDYPADRRPRYDSGYRGRPQHIEHPDAYGGGRARPRGRYPNYESEQSYMGPRRPMEPGYDYRRDRYDANFGQRWQTEAGDPFNDRGSHTPFRMMRGPFRERQQEDFREAQRREGWAARGYGADYSRRGYDPYEDSDRLRGTGAWEGYGQRGSRWGYDSDWW